MKKNIILDGCILVKDVKEILQKLATYHRKQLSIPIIGITGTNGKTTNKELLHCVLSIQYNCFIQKEILTIKLEFQ